MENNSTQSKATNPNKGIPEPSNVSSISITFNLPAAKPPSLDAVDYCNDPSSCTTNQYRKQEATDPLSSPIANRTRKQCAALKQHRATCDSELVPTPLPLSEITLPEAIRNVTKYHADYFRCDDGESANIVSSSMERQWSDVIMIGQKVKVKMKNEFVSAVVEKTIFVSKLASNSAYFYATAKVIVRLPDGSTPEFQFRELLL